MEKTQTYGIVGAGAIGQALGAALRRAGRMVNFWDHDKAKCSTESINELAQQSSTIILAAPSEAVRSVLRDIKPDLNGKAVLTVAKGVEKGFITMDHVLADELGQDASFGVMYGPMLAGEVMADEGGYGLLASNHPLPEVIRDFGIGGVKLRASTELSGVSTCAVLKNIYALGLGVIDGLDAGMNTKAALTVRILREMQSVLHQLQLPENLAFEQCGLGDLLATGWGTASYNHHIGEEIGGGATTGLGGEGLNSLMEISAVLEITNFPILSCLHHIIVSKAPAEQLSDLVRQ